MTALPTLSLSKATEAQINAAVAEYCAEWQPFMFINEREYYLLPPRVAKHYKEHPSLGFKSGRKGKRQDYAAHFSQSSSGWASISGIPNYLKEAKAVIELLEKQPFVYATFTGRWLIEIVKGGDVYCEMGQHFCRTGSIVLLRVSGKVNLTE